MWTWLLGSGISEFIETGLTRNVRKLIIVRHKAMSQIPKELIAIIKFKKQQTEYDTMMSAFEQGVNPYLFFSSYASTNFFKWRTNHGVLRHLATVCKRLNNDVCAHQRKSPTCFRYFTRPEKANTSYGKLYNAIKDI
uniref:Uncharacterized protein n=1 Tax=Clandestinovirus TaxID=2831644 RepID=A0A8F8KRK3_9VIRU|nr:hypothetical protein KOM_12_424 [Clandestinovirus]